MIEGSLALELPVKADGETALSVPLIVRERAGIARVNEPVTLGVPLPRGYAMPGQKWVVEDEAAAEGAAGCQTRPLALWRDGSVKWLLTTMAASCEPHGSRRVRLTPGKATGRAAGVTVVRLADRIEVDTSRGVFTLPAAGEVLLSRANVSGREVLSAAGIAAELSDDRGRVHRLRLDGIEVLEEGPLRVQVAFRGRFARMGLNCFGVWTFHANSAAVQLEITLHNPSRARHQSGCWDLGDPGSVRLREFAVRLCPAGDAQERVQWCEDGQPRWSGQSDNEVEIYQASSGGEAFDSRNHVNAAGQIPIEFRGYRVQCDGTVRFGLRAQPIAALQRGENWIAATVAEFWQQFPKAMNADEEGVRIGLFPAQFADGHELQGGEQKTHRIALDFGACGESDPARLACLIHPLEVRCDREWLSATEAILNLPPANVALRAEWQAMADDALAGERSFFAKREVIDEYGWRNYGDLWADHEEAYYDGPRPIISHYNNQYDGLQGFLLSYLTTEDRRWWDLADPLARHIIDIDIYHTQHDRAVYSGGLFWHTSHYVDAVTCTHRSYSRKTHPQGGGGLSNEHNYTSGLLLYYYLTGNRQARQAVESLAEWVIGMDDGRRHVLGVVHDEPTGFASQTTEPDYHRPGRGAGNSINALLDGWLATGRHEFLAKAKELIRRTIHPRDDVASLDLGNAELRWSYTVYLQTMLRILAFDGEFGFSQELLTYIKESVLAYARWMAEHERFYLDQPELLEYPTETWAAQELRKANVLMGAAVYAEDTDAGAFRQKAEWIYKRAWQTLMGMPTRTYTRPTILSIQLGLVEAAVRNQPSASWAISNQLAAGHATAAPFVAQKTAFRQVLRSPVGIVAAGCRSLRIWRWPAPLRATWLAQRLRTWRQRWLP